MSIFRTTRTVRFSHCDSAGIIFYPRYFDLIHEAKEDWFKEGLDWPFASMIGEMRNGFPIVRLEADFRGPSRIGDELTIALWVPVLGGASMHLHYAVTCGGEPRLDARTVIVHVDLDTGRPRPIGDALRARIERFRGDGGGDAPPTGAAPTGGRESPTPLPDSTSRHSRLDSHPYRTQPMNAPDALRTAKATFNR